MSGPTTSTADTSSQQAQHPTTEFEVRRARLVGQIGESLEQVLTQINGLNRSLEDIIEIGNEFASVEALWSQFETVMGRDEENEATGGTTHEQADASDGVGDGGTTKKS